MALPRSHYIQVFTPMNKGATVADKASDQSVVRRSGNFKPTIWKHELLQSLKSEFVEETYLSQIDALKKSVKGMLDNNLDEDPLKQLELIDTLERLGLSYNFEENINQILNKLHQRFHDKDNAEWKKNNLHATALEFRILRQHGYLIPQEVFIDFKDEMENLNDTCICEEKAKAMLALYEASYLAIEGESLLDEASHLALKYLEKYIKSWSNDEEIVACMVRHALELPLHWRMERLEARWFTDIYQRKADMNPILLELAKLDFNIVQSQHQEELKYASSWWKNIDFANKLGFVRDRVVTNFWSSVGLGFGPELGYCRIMSTKMCLFLTTIDDLYDIYGTLDELELFTNAVERWDVDAIDMLPYYMKLCFLAVHNTFNEMAFDILKDESLNVIQSMRKMWVDYCKSLLKEARWYHSNYKPTLEEYLDNAWMTAGGPIVQFHTYILEMRPLTREALERVTDYPDIFRHSSMVFRLTNDLTSSLHGVERVDVLKSHHCYMNDTGASEDEAQKYIKSLIVESWKKINEVGVLNPSCSPTFTKIALNLSRVVQALYQYNDGFTIEDHETKDRITSLFIKPI